MLTWEALVALFLAVSASLLLVHASVDYSVLPRISLHDRITVLMEVSPESLSHGPCPVERYYLYPDGTLRQVCADT